MSKQVKPRKNQRLFGSSLIIWSSFFYGSYGIWTKLMGDDFGAYYQAAIRAAIVVAVMLPIAIKGRQEWKAFRWRQDKWWFFWSAVASFFTAAPLYFSINKIGIGLSILMMYCGYLISMFVLGWIINNEKFGRDKIIATIMSVVGLVLTFYSKTDFSSLLPFVAAFTAGIAIGLDMVISQKVNYSSSQTTIIAWGTGLIVNLPAAIILGEHVPALNDWSKWVYLLIFAVANILASWLSIHGIKLIEAGIAGILSLLEIFWALLFGVLFFSENPGVNAYIGAVFIILAAARPYFKELKESRIIEEVPS